MAANNALQHAAVTDVGMRRSNNQDNHAVVVSGDNGQWRDRGHLFLVADGMGAHAAGELASKMAADGIPLKYFKDRDLPPAEALRTSVRELNAQIHARGESNLEFKGMGTTCSVLALLPEGAVVAHVGDSRVYRLRKGKLEQLSFDHSLVWELQAAGDFQDADTIHLPKNIITRSLGPNANVEVDLEGPFPLELGDTFLLCSDGLTGEVKDDEIGVILECLPPEEAARVLVDLANLRGGPDNITVIVAKVNGAELIGKPNELVDRVGGSSGGTVRSLLWLLSAASAAATCGALIAQASLPILVGGIVGTVLFGLFALLAKPIPKPPPRRTVAGGRYGKGPHTSRLCTANGRMVADLAKMAVQLREAATEQNWSIDWQRFESDLLDAESATDRKDHAAAVQAYCHAISFLMNELRHQGG
ncbi:MAG: protein phosphatase 2C domain-containing protein [Pirellulales bacterium]